MNKKFWDDLLKAWKFVMDDYIEIAEDEQDLPYWYGEKANSGFLAAAAWRMGGVAVEEYLVQRKGKNKKSEGRCDLWIKIKKGKETIDFSAEAKQLWPRYPKKTKADIKAALREARRQLRTICKEEDRGRQPVAICFITPQVQTNKEFQEIKDKIKDDFENGYIFDFYSPQGQAESKFQYEKYKYFGIILVAEPFDTWQI